MNVLQSHSKKYFFYQATSRARTVLWVKDMGVFSINKASILVKQNTIFSENKYPSYTRTWFLFFTHYHIYNLTFSCLDPASQINPLLVLEKAHK